MIHLRKKGILACLLAVMMMLISSLALADTGTVTASKLILREQASSSSKALQTLPKGTKLNIISKSGEWYRVTYGKYTGYVYYSYVDVAKTAATKDDDVLKKGDSGSDVKVLQERLKELGYFKSTCTGNYGTITVEAVKAFQKKNGLTADGIVGAATLKKLNSSSAISASGKTIAEATKNDGTLKKGDKGDEVKALQERLKELGFFKSTCTGNYGDVTTEAVKAFQKKNGLTADGIAGSSTQKKLNSSSAISANGKPLAEANKQNDGALKNGDKGDAVKALQERLKELGYFKSTCTGNYGTATTEAVKAFQKKNGLTADGVAGSSTQKKLNSTSAICASGKTLAEEKKNDGILENGESGDTVKALQERLKELGYFNSTCTGNYGSVTTEAVKAFQKKNGLTVDGIAGSSTLKKLNSSSALNANGKAQAILNTSQTLKQGNSGEQVKALQNALKELGYFTASSTGNYGYATATAVSEFQRCNKLTVNGIANPTTLKKLVSSSAISKSQADKAEKEQASKKYVTEKLDWFKNGKSVFANRPVIEVKDVRTGLVFKAKVLFGTNHLDVEPFTKADTAILLKINGGVDFTWHRRPMLVKHNGHVYAASIYSEPHGEQTIYDNNFDGQFCLHFYGSKTHGTGEVKDDHQACVAEAMKATW